MVLVETLLRESPVKHGVDGLPDDVVFSNHQLKAMVDRGVFRATAQPAERPDSHLIGLHPADLGNALRYERSKWRPRVSYYDPELADLVTVDKDEPYIERTYPVHKAHLSREIEGLDDPNVMYRGMSGEEYRSFLKTGEIRSHGTYNFDNQKGLTYWSTDVSAAVSYANGFAPTQWKPVIGHPCFVVAARLPPPNRIKHVPGTGSHEVGVIGATTADDVIAVWEGKVYDHDAEHYDLRPVSYGDYIDKAVRDGDTHRVRYGGYSAGVVWQRLK